MSIRPSKKRSSRRQLRFELLASRVLMAADLQWDLTPNLEMVVDTQAGDKSSQESSERKEDRDREPQNDRQQRRDPADLNRRSDARGRDEKTSTGDRRERFGKANETGRGVQSRERNSKQDQNRERQTTNPRAQGGSTNDEKSSDQQWVEAGKVVELMSEEGMDSAEAKWDSENQRVYVSVDRTDLDQHWDHFKNDSNETIEDEIFFGLAFDGELRINDDRPTPESESDAIDPDDDIQWAWDDDDDSTPNPTQDTPKGDMIATLLGDHGVTPYSKLANTIRGVYSLSLRNDPLIDPGHPTVGAVHRQQQDVGQIEELPHNYGLIDPDPRDEEHQRQEPQEGQDAEKNLDPWINPKRPGNDSPKGENGGKEGGKPPSREKAPRDKGQERR